MTKIKKHSSRNYKHRPRGVGPKEFEKVHWPYIPILMVVLLLLWVGLPGGGFATAAKHPSGKVLDYATTMSISGLLTATNTDRLNSGVPTLSLNSKLDAAAQAKANDMASRNYWSHNTPEGNPPWVFVTNQNYAYQKLGENLAAGFSSEQATENGWMASPPHRENVLDPAYNEVGFGFANNANYTSAGGGPMTIVVAYYGKPQVVAPPAASTTPPPASRALIQQPSAPANPPSTQTPAPASEPTPSLAPSETTKPQPQPENSDTQKHPGVILSLRATNAQVAFAKMPISNFATGIASFLLFAAAGLWLSRHLLILRKVLIRGESYIIHHPLVDVGLVLISILAYLLTRTAGFIQ